MMNKPVLFFEDIYEIVEKNQAAKDWGSIQRSDCTHYTIDRIMDSLNRNVTKCISDFVQEQRECADELIADQMNTVKDDWGNGK